MIPGRQSEIRDDSFGKKAEHRSCNVCDGDLTPRLSRVRDPLTGKSFTILACTRCGLGHTHPRPTDMIPYYGNHYHGGRHGITSKFCTRRSLHFLEHTAKKATLKRLLDVGCGDGSFLLAAKGAGWKVMGTEINSRRARALGLDVRESLEQIDHEHFDCITMWHSLEHMKDIKSTLNLIAGLLAPKGYLIIAVPNNDSLQASLFGPRWLHLDVPRHLYHFNPGSLRFSLENAGFRVCRSRLNETEYNLLGWSQSILNFLNPTPNIFLDFLTGKGKHHSIWARTWNLILGSMLTLASAVALPMEAWMDRDGTLVMTAYRKI